FECGSQSHHFIETLGLNAFQLRLILRLPQCETAFEMRPKVIPDFHVPRFAEPSCNASPHDPELNPNGLLFMKRDPCREQPRCLLAAPLIQRISESRAQSISRQLKPNPLVIGRSPSLSCSHMQRAPQFAQQWDAPLFPWSQRAFETAPQLFDL